MESLEARQMLAFAHPGVLNTAADFDRMATQVTAGAQPWASGYNALVSDGYSQINAAPRPLQTVIRGGTGQNFNQMVIDMQRTYQLAVRWEVSGDVAFANQAVNYLNAWSSTMTTLTGNADRFLASGLYGFGWAAAAEIMRGYSGWAAADVTKFQNYLLDIYVPMQRQFLTNHNDAYITNYWANWDLANIEGMMAIGIFTDRQDLYDEAMNYLMTGGGNGALDKMVYFMHPGNLAQWQESGRDQGHTILGMQLFGHIAQMAWQQGDDLFAYNNYQFLAAAEYIAKYNLGHDVPFETYNWGTGQNGAFSSQPGVSGAGRGDLDVGYELIVAHYVDRLGMAAPYSEQRIAARGTEWRGSGDDFGFGTLTYPLVPVTTGLAPKATAREKGAGAVELNWYGVSNATGYNVYRAASAGGPYVQIASNVTDLLTFTDFNLPPGVYYYKVTGIVGAGETGDSNIVSATSTSLPHTQLSFDEAAGTTAADATGNGHAGTLANGATWTTGKTGSAALLTGDDDFVSLPEGVVAGMNDFTISTWVYLNDLRTWSRIFDFGDARGRWMMLTPRNGNGQVEFATSTVYGYNKQWVVGSSALPTNQWVHVAVTLANRVGTIYVNGVAVGSSPNMDFAPFQFASTPRNWIGRSQYGSDPYLNGRIDDFRISEGAMKAGEIYTLATGNPAPSPPAAPANLTATAIPGNQINLSWPAVAGATAGYTVKRSTTSTGPYTVIANRLTGTTFSDAGRTAGTTYYYLVTADNNGGESANPPQASATALPPLPATPGSLTARSNSAASIFLSWNAAADAASYTVKRSLTTGGPYATVASGLTTISYTDPGLTTGTTYFYVVAAVNAAGESTNSNQASDAPSDRHARLTFYEAGGLAAADVTGNAWNGALVNGPLWTTGKSDAGIDLDGANDYVSLPAGVVNGLTGATITAWINLDAVATWQRVFDFGTGTSNYMFLTTQTTGTAPNNNKLRFAIRTASVGEQQITSSVATPIGSWAHVAVVLSGSVGTLFLNGVQVGQNAGMTLNPTSLGNTTQNYLGKSQFADPYLNGKIDDFRIYSRALSGSEVSALATTPLLPAPTNVSATTTGPDQIDLAWNAVAGATGYTILRSTASNGPYTLIASRLATTSYQDLGLVPDPATGTFYYKVQAENAAGEGATSAQVSAQILPPLPESPEELIAAPANSGSIALTWTASANAASYTLSRSTAPGGPYGTIAAGLTGTAFTDSGLANGTTYYYIVIAVNAAGDSVDPPGASATPTELRTRLKFDETAGAIAADSSGQGYIGSLVSGPLWTSAGKLGRALDFDGANDYVALPAGVVNGLTTATLSAWVYLDSAATWSRIFDFGTGTTNFMFLTASAGSTVRFSLFTGGVANDVNGTAPLPTGAWTHVAVTLAGGVGVLYVNGAEVGRNNAMTLTPSSLGNTTQNYIGKSQFADPYLNGRVDDFRIFSRALTAAEVSGLTYVPANPGDYTLDGDVDGDDFLVWQRQLGAVVLPFGSGADGDVSGRVDAADLAVWRGRFGTGGSLLTATSNSASAAAVVAADEADAAHAAVVSEPSSSGLAEQRAWQVAAQGAPRSLFSPPQARPTSLIRRGPAPLHWHVTSSDQAVQGHRAVRAEATESLASEFADRQPNATTTEDARARVFASFTGLPAIFAAAPLQDWFATNGETRQST